MPTSDDVQLPLAGIRVLDLCTGPGASASRLLADLGADVVTVESPDTGGRLMTDLDRMTRTVRLVNKRSIVLDLRSQTNDLDIFWQLAGTFDIVFEDRPPAAWDEPVTAQTLRERLPGAVIVAVTDFGQTGPYRDWAATDAVHVALSGELSRSGLPGREPLLPPGRIASEAAAAQAAWSALAAYSAKLDGGGGQLVDFSLMEAVSQTLDPGWGMGGSATGGKAAAAAPRGRPDVGHQYPVFACADGHVRICILAPRQWQGMFHWLGEPEDLADPGLASLFNRFAAWKQIQPAIERLFAERTRAQIVAEGRALGVPAAAILTPSEVFEVEQFRARDAFTEVPVEAGVARVANGMVEVDGRRAGMRQIAPSPDADRAAILEEAGEAPRCLDSRSSAIEPGLPLQGLRVLDLGVIVAGAEVGRLFADMGADVIKVENSQFPDGARQSFGGELISTGVAWGHRNKQSLGLNLRSPDGVAVFKELVAHTDVVLSNFKPGTMEKLGLSYEELSAVNPSIVVADSSAYGPSGPWSDRMGYGPLVRCETGLSGLWRYVDDPAGLGDAATVYPDHTAARVEATAVLALLLRRRSTGRGGRVSVAQAEVILGQMAVEYAVESVRPGSMHEVGNALPGDAPRGVYPCQGDDEWIVVDVRDDGDFTNLAHAVGHPEWVTDERFASSAGRDAHRDVLDRAVIDWAAAWPAATAARILQAAGVPAAMMLRVLDQLHDPQFVERHFFRTIEHPLLSYRLPSENLPAVFEKIPDAPLRPAPLAGEHTREVLRRVLGYGNDRVDALIAEGAAEEAPPVLSPTPSSISH
ncbi:MAG: CoA transferase [Mycobacterium sp.]